ncbi:glycosyltransferase [Vibrio vulnificus]|uniref:Glycosyl transferase family 1 domain-containing protein n=1 Tax=Vibrio vulnificus TaxID=672 RepID=A0ABX4X082_VIBVL|nr:glycosyltransferase [Vibrio vulnificus]ASC55862.1 Glycosyltransferase [Vibrio vulnificus]EGQ7939459.1 glycosyltransferase family 4 protein [Vibrio vulnificus]EGQ7991960.1 glycosyltransferase family 4 protein [Vibrio vulnificus]EGQ8072420.1 glycosyltransferase family 4 protein [Vibrio vulnificus]EGQ9938507.1 glycosyltransferase family 4 protein [Vibrio vulnificus]
MKILQVMVHGSAHGYAGGTQKVMVELGNSLSERGHEVTSIYNDISPGELFFRANNGAKIVNLATPNRGKLHLGKKVLREITRPLRKTKFRAFFPDPLHVEKASLLGKPVGEYIEYFKPDVILAYGIQDLNSIVAGRQYFKHTAPIIHMTHCEVDTYYKELTHRDRRNIINCDAIQALTPYFSERFSSLLGREVDFVPNIVTPPNNYAFHSNNKSRYRVMMHSRLDKKKQQHLLIEAFSKICKEYPSWELVIFGGENTKGYLAYLESIVEKAGITDQVTIFPATSEVEQELCKSDIFAFPSVHEEGWGLVLTEAMSVGLPCIGIRDTSAVRFLIESEDAGLLCANDVTDFSEKLKELMSSSELRVRYGANGRMGMEKYYADQVCMSWERLFDRVIEKHSVATR